MSSWDSIKIEKLKALWGRGNTASQIAEIIGGVTRNAVIGKANRLNLSNKIIAKSPKTSNVNKNSSDTSIKKERRTKFKSLILDSNFPPENPLQLEQLTDKNCKWPIGHPDQSNFYFCGRQSLYSYSYCELHLFQAFQPKNYKKEDLLSKDDDVPKFIEKKIKSA